MIKHLQIQIKRKGNSVKSHQHRQPTQQQQQRHQTMVQLMMIN